MNDLQNEAVVISQDNISALQWVEKDLSPEMKAHFANIKKAIIETVNDEWREIKFKALIRLIDFVFDTHPVRFVNGWVDNKAWENLSSLKVLSIALLLWLNTNQALMMFWEHNQSIKKDPNDDNHPNIRELDWNWLEWVKIHWIPFWKK